MTPELAVVRVVITPVPEPAPALGCIHTVSGVPYRCVSRDLPTREGWATGEYWQGRLGLDESAVLELVSLGFLEATLHLESGARKYRCRDWEVMKSSDVWFRLAARKRKRKQREREYAKGSTQEGTSTSVLEDAFG